MCLCGSSSGSTRLIWWRGRATIGGKVRYCSFSPYSHSSFFCLISLIIILSFLFSHFILINSHSFICIFSFCYSHVRFQNTWNEYISLVWEKCTVFYWIFSFLKGLKANSRSYVYIMECGLINSMQWMDVLINCFSE